MKSVEIHKSIEIQKQDAIQVHSDTAGQFADSYRDMIQSPYRTCFTYSRKRLDACLERYLPQHGNGLRLLDIGCGTGHQMASLRERGFEVSGIDGSPEMLEHARANNPQSEIHQADVEKLPFASSSFDMLLCIEVLRYLPDPGASIREMARVLRPGGVALVTATPLLSASAYWPINRLTTMMPLGSLSRLKQFFSASWQLRREFRSAGFHAPSIHGVWWGPGQWVAHIAPGLVPGFHRFWESIDSRTADSPVVREFSNMFLIHAVRKGEE